MFIPVRVLLLTKAARKRASLISLAVCFCALQAMSPRLGTTANCLAQPQALPTPNAAANNERALNSSSAPVKDIAGLPRVLLLGDSISIGYTSGVQQLFAGRADVQRAKANCGPTTRGLEQLENWLGDQPWDVIHFNFGLHDLKTMQPAEDSADAVEGSVFEGSVDEGRRQVSPAEYEQNLTQIVARLQATGARLIWCTTTPVPAGAKGRIPGDEVKYNQIAARVIATAGDIATNDLHGFTAGRLQQFQRPADVHFTATGSRQMALQVAKAIDRLLPQPVVEAQLATGFVFHDANNNGVMDEGEAPLEGIRVSNGRAIVTTDARGQYSLEVLGDTILHVIKPAHWRTPLDDNNLPKFYYIHKPHGSPISYFAGVAPTGPLPDRIDFPLYPQREPEQFKALLFGDPQPRDQKEVDYIAHDVIEELIGSEASFGVTLGDIMFDDLNLFGPNANLIGLIGIPWYNVIGNHDLNTDSGDDRTSDETFERNFGPAYYSFDHGPVHFLVLDDVEWLTEADGKRHYRGGLGEQQMEFIRNDLALIPDDQLVVLMMHIPLTDVKDRHELYRLIEQRPFCMSISGHTHHHEHRFITAADGWQGAEPHHHVINVTVSGSWWSGLPDERGIPHTIMADGAPNGYSIISFDGTNYHLDFKAAGRSADYQMQVHCPELVNASKPQEAQFMANVFNGSEQSQVDFRIDGGDAWTEMQQVFAVDPSLVEVYDRETKIRGQLLEAGAELKDLPPEMSAPKPSTHLWQAALPEGLTAGVHWLEVREQGTDGRLVYGRRTFRVPPQ